jgi:hypothetical protein
VSLVSVDIEGLSLDAGRLHGGPFQVIFDQLGVGGVILVLPDCLNGRGTVDGLFGAHDVGQSGSGAEGELSGHMQVRQRTGTDVCLAQLNMAH